MPIPSPSLTLWHFLLPCFPLHPDAHFPRYRETRRGAHISCDSRFERFGREVWVHRGEVLRGEESEKGVAQCGEELVGIVGRGRVGSGERRVGETSEEQGVEVG